MSGDGRLGMPEDRLQIALRESARISGTVALYCDRTEHNEPAAMESLRASGSRLRYLAGFIADCLAVDLQEAYAGRLERLEQASPMEPLLPSPAQEVRRAATWRDLQVAQIRHDRHFHADVFGMPKREQLIHIGLHLSKLTAAVAALFDAEPGVWLDFTSRRLPDMLLFGIKLSTVVGEQLDRSPIEARSVVADLT